MCFADEGSAKGAEGHQTVVYRKDYAPPAYQVETVELDFNLDEEVTLVKSVVVVKPTRAEESSDLVLNGEGIELISVAVNGRQLTEDDFELTEETLRIPRQLLSASGTTELKIENKNFPSKNLQLFGLYKSDELLTTQCEAEGFRRITYFIDRPDIMARYTVRIEADKAKYPVLLSNGDIVSTDENLGGGTRHAAVFVDPIPKPTHIFAVVCGPLECLHDTFTTMAVPNIPSHKVDLYVYAEKKYMPQMHWAMESLKRAMKWDEKAYGRAYDINTFRIVAITGFNFGAMENRSLTTYNVSAILAHKDTSTDAGFERVLTVVGHEYFHNWSGNRVNVRDWFQITLKEGFTRLREQEFAAYEFSSAVQRLENVRLLRATQFPEDAGPMAHSIRPESYVQVNNFYTATVYNKGAEVIHMMKTLVGLQGFRKGTDLYFDRYDGLAISCDEFRNAIAIANGRDFTQFELWYKQKGTAKIQVTQHEYNAANKTYTLGIKQVLPDYAGEAGAAPQAYHMPIVTGLVGKQSKKNVVPEKVLELTKWEDTFVFENVEEDVVPSILRGFSAPVIVEPFLSTDELAFLMANDSDPFNVYDAGQEMYKQVIFDRYKDIKVGARDYMTVSVLSAHIAEGVRGALKQATTDAGFAAYRLSLPSVAAMETELPRPVDPVALWKAKKSLAQDIRAAFHCEFQQTFEHLRAESAKVEYEPSKEQIGRRSLQNTLLAYLCNTRDEKEMQVCGTLVSEYYKDATNFNDKSNAFDIMVSLDCAEREDIMASHYALCKDDVNMLDGWFRQQTMSTRPSAMTDVKKLMDHKDYVGCTNPNRFRAITRTIPANVPVFHDVKGEGYMLAATEIVRFDSINGHVAALTAKPLVNFGHYDEDRQAKMIEALKFMKTHTLSKNTLEVVNRGLDAHQQS